MKTEGPNVARSRSTSAKIQHWEWKLQEETNGPKEKNDNVDLLQQITLGKTKEDASVRWKRRWKKTSKTKQMVNGKVPKPRNQEGCRLCGPNRAIRRTLFSFFPSFFFCVSIFCYFSSGAQNLILFLPQLLDDFTSLKPLFLYSSLCFLLFLKRFLFCFCFLFSSLFSGAENLILLGLNSHVLNPKHLHSFQPSTNSHAEHRGPSASEKSRHMQLFLRHQLSANDAITQTRTTLIVLTLLVFGFVFLN